MASDYIFPAWKLFYLNYKLILNPTTYLTNALGNRLISQTQHGSLGAFTLISHPTRSLLGDHQHVDLTGLATGPSNLMSLPHSYCFSVPVKPSWFFLLKAFQLVIILAASPCPHHHPACCISPAPRVSKCSQRNSH